MNEIFKIYLTIALFKLSNSHLDERVGRIDELDGLISDPYVLKAIAFSSKSKDLVYQQVLVRFWQYLLQFGIFSPKEELIESHRLKKYRNMDKISRKNFDYYVYILKNVKKFTSRWLIEEINHLIDKSYAKPDDADIICKKNIANFVYHTASEYAIDLVLNGMDTSLAGWQNSKKINRDEL